MPKPTAADPGLAKASTGAPEAASAGAPEGAFDRVPAPEPMPESYEAALAELEQLVSRMEAGALPLEQLLVAYQRGGQLLAFCRDRLQAVEAQVKVLDEGQLKPWDAA